MNAQAGRFQDRAQIGDRGAFAVGAGDMNDRRQSPFGMIELREQPMHPLQAEIDAARMQSRQPRDQRIERGLRSGGRRVHACGAAGAVSGAMTTGAASETCGTGLGAFSRAGDFVNSRSSRPKVGRNSWRCTTMSIMP